MTDVKEGTPSGDLATTTRAPSRREWVRAAADRVPTKWIATIGTVLFLAATAAFGGLQAVATPPLPEITSGDTFSGAGLEITPVEAYLTDVTRGTSLWPDDDEVLLALVVDVVNTGTEPRGSVGTGSVKETRLVEAPDAALAIQRADDGTGSPWLQPQVPARLLLLWQVTASDFAVGEEVEVELHDADQFIGSSVVSGAYWSDVRLGAHLTLTIDRHEREVIE